MLFPKRCLAVAASLVVTLTHAQNESPSAEDLATVTALKTEHFANTFGSACACKLLIDLFGSQILTPNGTAYEAQAIHYYDLRADLTPGCIFVPTTANEVAVGVVVLDICQSQFAVRGAGHMPVNTLSKYLAQFQCKMLIFNIRSLELPIPTAVSWLP